MTCSEFRQLWNERLDDPTSGVGNRLARIEAHAAVCASCRILHSGYDQIAEHGWAPPQPPHGLGDRTLEIWKAEQRTSLALPARWRSLAPVASWAAVLLVTFFLSLRIVPGVKARRPELAPLPPPRPLSLALAEATSATFDLVREASEPAARVGQHLLGPYGVGEPARAYVPQILPSPASFDGVGARVDVNVRSLSTSARRAFGFLGGPVAASPPAVKPRDAGA